MRSLLIVIGCFVSVWGRGVSDAPANIETEGLISGGTFAEPRKYPFVAEFVLKNNKNGFRSYCAGSILSQWWIVTAAHCLEKDPFYVVVGQYNRTKISPFEVRHNISFSVIHRSYNTSGLLNNDIALLKMEKRILFNAYVKPANLPTSDVDYSGRTGTIIGWGLTERKSKENEASCLGDSGGPLIVREGNKDVVIGIISRSSSSYCGDETPGIYVLIYKFRNWIAGVTQNTRTISIQRGRERKVRW
ncbi:hypothetical protein JTE90_022367 [Oedothorax gibbosus]|uniref:Peptidase S1 domain-containing protein n=1 Tax=Oedothorax gibbosus TaxID=931172 RepID=A0AAV6UME6_9ARAC|nr:hypothetical protein JTE90_022367 [Oedothorax gibbosus]